VRDPLGLPDLAVRTFGGAVVWANDEAFAGRENLVNPGRATFAPRTFGAKGQVYDGWETRRRRPHHEGDHDEAIVRLGAPGVVRAVVVDTSHFTGNFPSEASVEGVCADGTGSATCACRSIRTVASRGCACTERSSPTPVWWRR
jgi:allantoicase